MRNVPLVNVKVQFDQIKEEAEKDVLEILRTGQYVLGKHGKEFEEKFASFTEAKHALTCHSGTDALLLALAAVGVKAGDEVITTPFTFIATAEAICYLGATPVFVDIEPETFCIDISKIEEKITDKTKVILPVHLYGQSVDVDAINEIAKKHSLKVIGDACQSVGVKYKGKGIGGMFDAECFSFFPTKNLGAAGEGGAVTTNDDEIADKVRYLRVHGMRERYKHEMIGYNSRLDEIQCAVLKHKLSLLAGWTKRRNEIATKYNQAFGSIEDIETPLVKEYSDHVYHQYTLVAKNRDDITQHLSDNGIGNAVHYPIPLHLQKCFEYLGLGEGSFPVAEATAKKIFSLPAYPELSDEDVDYVIEKVKEGCK